jgi:outer membrane protein TolC
MNRAAFIPALAIVAASAAAADLSFHDALARAVAANESLLAADQAVRAGEEERAAARALRYPRLDASARYTKIDSPLLLDLSPIRDVILQLHPNVPPGALPSFVETIQKERFFLADVTFTWPVYTGGKIDAAGRAADAHARDAVQQRRLTQEEVTDEVVRRYFGLRLAIAVRQLRRQASDALATHLAQARRLEEEGMIARAERLHAEVAHAEAERDLARADHDVEVARAALADTLAVDDEAVTPSTPLFLVRRVEPLPAFVRRADAESPVIARLAAQGDLAAQGLAAAKARFLPDVALFGRRELHKADLTILDPGWAVGAAATITLFDGFERNHRLAAAADRQKQLALVERKARRDISTLVEARFRDLATAKEQFEALDATIALAAENLRVRDRAFEEGMATSLDVVDARVALSKVQLERVSAAYDFDVALADLLSACGEGSSFEEYLARADVEVER